LLGERVVVVESLGVFVDDRVGEVGGLTDDGIGGSG
jgi:hypothetical protein